MRIVVMPSSVLLDCTSLVMMLPVVQWGHRVIDSVRAFLGCWISSMMSLSSVLLNE